VVIGDRLKNLREEKRLSQGDIEKRTGLLRCYLSRVENGHTVPSVDTLEKIARALEVPMYRIFTEDAHVKKPKVAFTADGAAEAKLDHQFRAFARVLARVSPERRVLFFNMASKMARS
jgi:transcriptional regulator with XRE-family HTH domain